MAGPPQHSLRDYGAAHVYRKGQQIFEAALTPFVKQCMQEAFPTVAGSSPEDDAHLAAVQARVEREATRVQELTTVRDVELRCTGGARRSRCSC
jgi:hypothetical protein